MQKIVLQLDIPDERIKKKAFKTVSSCFGIDSVAIDMKERRLTAIGDIDTVTVVKKLRKICSAHIVTVGPAKEPEKKPEPKKPDPPKPEVITFPVMPPCYFPWHANTCQHCGGGY